jgi:DNA-binding NarL/FixJ family response regulator
MTTAPVPVSARAWTGLPEDLQALQLGLSGATTVSELFAHASAEVCRSFNCRRALILQVRDGWLTAEATGPIEHDASDALRRRVLAQPVELTTGCAERALVRRPGRRPEERRPSVLQEALGLDRYLLSASAPRGHIIALVVAERRQVTQQPGQQRALDIFAHMVGLTLDVVVAHERLRELTADLRVMYTSATAILAEATEGTTTVGGAPLPTVGAAYLAKGPGWITRSPLEGLLTGREPDVARLMAVGHSNRQIAAALHLSTDTVKGYVGRVLHKLGASNRVEAVVRYRELAGIDPSQAGS